MTLTMAGDRIEILISTLPKIDDHQVARLLYKSEKNFCKILDTKQALEQIDILNQEETDSNMFFGSLFETNTFDDFNSYLGKSLLISLENRVFIEFPKILKLWK